ncbi:hypothetical protein NAPIS_ORF00175 [Vairimorpha apis BRL 01]|uniref:Uncharacterized protein n=1 Tax=Vairimorpha apis BRL 01 TaxID=1037528 RepID=T0L419_9MICR|nr:hypothetical protein NAPIS_ORF00175 [Vairimorpha apis BRL 01]
MLYTVFIFASNINDSLINLNNCLEFDNDFKIKEANNLQKEKLHKISLSIEPVFKIISYFLDPYVIDCCYIYVENLQSKEIKHHTIFFHDTIQLEKITQKILFEEVYINESFKSCILLKNHINDDYKKFCFLPIFSFDKNFYVLVKRLIFDFDCFLYRTNCKLAHLYTRQTKNTRYSTLHTIDKHKKVSNFILMCINLGSSKFQLQCLFLENKKYQSLNAIIEKIFGSKIHFLNNFMQMSLSEKESNLMRSTDLIYQTLKNYKISSSDLILFTYNRIKLIKHKINQYTLFLCFSNLYNKQHGNKNVFKMIRLIGYIYGYFLISLNLTILTQNL